VCISSKKPKRTQRATPTHCASRSMRGHCAQDATHTDDRPLPPLLSPSALAQVYRKVTGDTHTCDDLLTKEARVCLARKGKGKKWLAEFPTGVGSNYWVFSRKGDAADWHVNPPGQQKTTADKVVSKCRRSPRRHTHTHAQKCARFLCTLSHVAGCIIHACILPETRTPTHTHARPHSMPHSWAPQLVPVCVSPVCTRSDRSWCARTCDHAQFGVCATTSTNALPGLCARTRSPVLCPIWSCAPPLDSVLPCGAVLYSHATSSEGCVGALCYPVELCSTPMRRSDFIQGLRRG
jgi:hypothetical protein